MINDNKTAILLGASGLVGGILLDMLLDSSMYSTVKVFVRKLLAKEHPKLVQYVIDFDQPQTYKHLVEGDVLFCCLGTTIKKAGSKDAFRKVDYEYPLLFARMAKENNVKQYLIISSIGANRHSSVFYTRTKGECEDVLKTMGLDSLKIFRPSLLWGKRDEFRLGEQLSGFAMKAFSFLMIGKWKKYRPIKASQVAKGMLMAAEASSGGTVVYESDRISLF